MKAKSVGPNLVSTPPVGMLFKPLTLNVKDLLTAVGKGLIHGASAKWDELAIDTLNATAALGLETEPGEQAFVLVKRAVIAAIFELIKDSADQLLQSVNETSVDNLNRLTASAIEAFPVQLSPTFLNRPADIKVVTYIRDVLTQWFVQSGLPPAKASSFSNRFSSYFVFALIKEWRINAKSYELLKDAFENPFSRAGAREWGWRTYNALLQKRVAEPTFDEFFSLRQIFVPPIAYYVERLQSTLFEEEDIRNGQRVVIQLREELLEWLSSSDREEAIRVISGGPGSGKSSFARIFAADVAASGQCRVLFVPLHLLDPTGDLTDEIGRFVKDEGILAENPLDPESQEENLLIIFDGLDELASQGKAAAELARQFVREVDKTLQRRNMSELRLRVIISGRELVVQENESDFRKRRQIINLLPYYTPKGSDGRYDGHSYAGRVDLISIDLRNRWWNNYGKLTGQRYKTLPQELRRSDLDEITAQPLLNYLVALSFTRGQIDFGKDVNLNLIYADLMAAIYDRGYEKHRPYAPIKPLSFENFVRVLEEIGLAAWHGDGRTTSVNEIEQHCRTSGIGRFLDAFQDGAKAGVTKLLAAFFFRKHGQRATGEPTFVFTHKSFGEYLAARRVTRAMIRIHSEKDRRRSNPDEGWDDLEALRHWAIICGPSALTPYITKFLRSEVRTVSAIAAIHSCFESLFDHVLLHSLPMEATSPKSFRQQMFEARNAEEALLVAVNACALSTQRMTVIGSEDHVAFGRWFRWIQGQRTGPQSSLAADCLSYLDLSSCYLDLCDLYGTDFTGSSLSFVPAHYSNISMSTLKGANLEKSIFQGASVEGVNFSDANLEDADFSEARIHGCLFANAKMIRTRIPKSALKQNEFTQDQLDEMQVVTEPRRNFPRRMRQQGNGLIEETEIDSED